MRRLYHILAIVFLGSLMYLISTSNLSLPYLNDVKNSEVSLEKAGLFGQKPVETPVVEPIKILILGDMMFDRGVRSQINSKGFDYVFGSSSDMFEHYDKVIANLEGPITTFGSKNVLENNKAIPGFQFTFQKNTAVALKKVGIDIVGLANNHAYNFGTEGLVQTRANLVDAGVQFFGSPENNTNIATTTCIARPDSASDSPSAQKICIGIIGWHEFGTKNYQKILDEITALRPQVDYLIVYPHWGVEYEKTPTEMQTNLAHGWLDAGADAVIGAHPHVVQKIEQYKTVDGRTAPIFYSLGNFIFDQYFSFDTTHGVGVEIEFPVPPNPVSQNNVSPVIFSTPTISATSVALTATSTTLTSTRLIAASATYKIIPFESTGSRVSIPNASSTTRMIKDIETVSGKNIWSFLKK